VTMINPRAFPLGRVDIRRTAPRRGRLLGDFAFVSPTQGEVTVSSGFETDYASIPRVFWSIYPPDGDYTEAAVVHDYLYWYQPCTRAEADRVFLEAMEALGIPWHRRHILHKAVRMGGWIAWNKNQKERQLAET